MSPTPPDPALPGSPTPASPDAAEAVSRRYAVDISGQTITLDVFADRYLMTPAACGGGDVRLALPPPPDSVAWPEGRADPGAAITAFACVRRVARCLASRSFAELVDMVAGTPVRGRRRPLGGLLASYEALRPFFPEGRICRLDAPATCLLLRQHGVPARLVFGVRLEPFAAHCWAEAEGHVLNESAHLVRGYTPILAV